MGELARTLLTRLPPGTLAVTRAIAVLSGEDLELVADLAGSSTSPCAARTGRGWTSP
jgi:hypothetical protein